MALSMETHVYATRQRCDLRADVYLPEADGARPVIVWMHGGALIAGHRAGVPAREVSLYCESGYTLVSIDYRLAPETKLAGIIDDVRDGFAWVRGRGPALFGADANRIVAMGPSAGGYLTLMTGFSVQPRVQALVAVAGYGDVAAQWYSRPDPFYLQQPLVEERSARRAVGREPTVGSPDGASPRGAFYLYCRQRGLWPQEVAGHDPDAEPDAFDRFCPVRNVDARYPPTLLIHGDRDTDVPYEQSVMMADALRAAGVEHELITIEGGGHCSMGTGQAQVRTTYDRVLAFLEKHVRA